jgi:hypothetical protein
VDIGRALLLFCVLGIGACDETAPTSPTVPLNAEFTLAPGELVAVEKTSVRIGFDRVIGDSRCPTDVVCIQGGDAIVRIEVRSWDGRRDSYDLHTGDMRPVRHSDLTIQLVRLLPYPFSSRTIEPADYRATLRVTR